MPNRILVGMLLLLAGGGNLARAEEFTPNAEPLLTFIDKVPLRASIRNLARQTKLNIILDPHVPGEPFARGPRVKEPIISRRWTNATPEQALRTLLKENQLILVTNSATTVARIAPGSVAVWPLSPGAAGVENDTSEWVPLIVIDEVPLLDALKNVCRQLGIKPIFDADVTETFTYDCEVYIHWESLTVRQALAALLDNYGLVMKENPSAGTARIRFINRGSRKQTARFDQ